MNFRAKIDIKYIEYERLKDVLYEFKENAPAEDSVEKSEIERYFQQSSESFFQEIEKELQKVNLFFGEKLNEAARRFTQLKVNVILYRSQMPPRNAPCSALLRTSSVPLNRGRFLMAFDSNQDEIMLWL